MKVSFVLMFFILVTLLCSTLSAQETNLPFNVNEIVEQVSRNRALPSTGSMAELNTRTNEFLIDTNITYIIPVPNNTEHPAVAFNGTYYLVVWADDREAGDWYFIRGTRVNQDGVVLDPTGIVISPQVNARDAVVASDSQNYLVIWSDGDIYGALVNQDGKVLERNPIAVSTAENTQSHPAIAFNGTDYLVVWEDRRSRSLSYDIYGARVTPNSVVLDTHGIAISTAADGQLWPSVAVDDTNCLVVWNDHRSGTGYDIYGARVTHSGTVLDTAGIAISTAVRYQTRPSVVFGERYYLIVWQDGSGTDWDIYGVQVDRDGHVIDTAGITVSSEPNAQHSPSVSVDHENYLVVWEDERNDSRDIYGTRISQSGVVLDPTGIPVSAAKHSEKAPSVVFGDDNYLVVWNDDRTNVRDDIYGARVTLSGVVLDTQGIDISCLPYRVNSQRDPAIAFDGINYLVVWSDERNNPVTHYDIYGARVSPNGIVLDQPAIAISTAEKNQIGPAVAFDGTNYLVVWRDERNDSWDIYATRINQSGVVLDPAGIAIPAVTWIESGPSIAFDGKNYLVAWAVWDIYGARISQSGTTLDTSAILICTSMWDDIYPDVAFDGTNYLVVYQSHGWSAGAWHSDIYGTRVSQAGTVLGTYCIAPSGSLERGNMDPSVCFDGTNYLVVWVHGYFADENVDIYGRRVSQNGTLVDPAAIPICTAALRQESPSVVFDGIDYVVVWRDLRSGSWDIYGAKVDTSCSTVSTFPVSLQSGTQASPALAHGLKNQVLVTWSGWADSINNHPVNTMRIWGKFHLCVGTEEDSDLDTHIHKRYLSVYPNPAHKECRVTYAIPYEADVSISLFDVTGRLVEDIVKEKQDSGTYQESIDVSDQAQGVYFIKLDAQNYSEVQKVIFMK